MSPVSTVCKIGDDHQQTSLQMRLIHMIFAEKEPTKKLELLGYAKKLAHRHAFENAFRRVMILSLDNGKVGVEINQQDIPDCSLDELREDGIVHVIYMEKMPYSETEDEEEAEHELKDVSCAAINIQEVT